MLREKDLSEAEYAELAGQVTAICAEYGVPCILHTYVDVAERIGACAVHLSMPDFRRICEDTGRLPAVPAGVSCHSVDEAVEAESLGCAYITAGHIFDTECKEGLPGRGLSFLSEVCERVSVPVLAIGGISPDNIADVRAAGASGACVMSGIMRCADVEQFLRDFSEEPKMRRMEFKMERIGLLEVGDVLPITEYKLPNSWYYVLGNSFAMSANYSNRERLSADSGRVVKVMETPKGYYVIVECDEREG